MVRGIFSLASLAVKENCPFIEHYIQFAPPEQCNPDTICAFVLAKEAGPLAQSVLSGEKPELAKKYMELCAGVKETDGCQVIYTTGSTGFPKPALLSHRGITSQCLTLGKGFDINDGFF